jgi:GDP-L-fucose synthase
MLLVQLQSYRDQYGFNGIFLIPTNMYGPGDNFDLRTSHVIPAVIRKIDDAIKENKNSITLWGTGKVSREFLYVGDCAEAIMKATQEYDKKDPVNIGTGTEISIKELAEKIAELMGFKGEIIWDRTNPDGQPRRRLDTSKAKNEFGWYAKVDFEEGLKRTIEWYRKNRK